MGNWAKQCDDPANEPKSAGRRGFLRAAAAGAVAAAVPMNEVSAAEKVNITNLQELAAFLNKNAGSFSATNHTKPLGNQLQELAKDKNVLISFGYESCGSGICPIGYQRIVETMKKNPDLVHITFDVSSQSTASLEGVLQGAMQRVLGGNVSAVDVRKKHLVISVNDLDSAVGIQKALGFSPGRTVADHTPGVAVLAKSGRIEKRTFTNLEGFEKDINGVVGVGKQ